VQGEFGFKRGFVVVAGGGVRGLRSRGGRGLWSSGGRCLCSGGERGGSENSMVISEHPLRIINS
jgi:hypothetical protein